MVAARWRPGAPAIAAVRRARRRAALPTRHAARRDRRPRVDPHHQRATGGRRRLRELTDLEDHRTATAPPLDPSGPEPARNARSAQGHAFRLRDRGSRAARPASRRRLPSNRSRTMTSRWSRADRPDLQRGVVGHRGDRRRDARDVRAWTTCRVDDEGLRHRDLRRHLQPAHVCDAWLRSVTAHHRTGAVLSLAPSANRPPTDEPGSSEVDRAPRGSRVAAPGAVPR